MEISGVNPARTHLARTPAHALDVARLARLVAGVVDAHRWLTRPNALASVLVVRA